MRTDLLDRIADARAAMIMRGASPESLAVCLGRETLLQLAREAAPFPLLDDWNDLRLLGMPVREMMDTEGFAVKSMD
ncbi:hypothetical protein [Paenirhodobacter sp. CAU 1674]|uniref:hypothetical protein n=1 Tax=Paenirhodobacter sp. CAU 1674 TaxID=3032596 RepID=UPI0023DBAB9C|nr:hypothetical protein [Paenirhodobacter sp. CAU 1674]MDF2143203.1 hypothetical protein [Paenirhodobacter sp. CAU 1674]